MRPNRRCLAIRDELKNLVRKEKHVGIELHEKVSGRHLFRNLSICPKFTELNLRPPRRHRILCKSKRYGILRFCAELFAFGYGERISLVHVNVYLFNSRLALTQANQCKPDKPKMLSARKTNRVEEMCTAPRLRIHRPARRLSKKPRCVVAQNTQPV